MRVCDLDVDEEEERDQRVVLTSRLATAKAKLVDFADFEAVISFPFQPKKVLTKNDIWKPGPWRERHPPGCSSELRKSK